jgi:cytochrome P450
MAINSEIDMLDEKLATDYMGLKLTPLDERFRDNRDIVLDELRAQSPIHKDNIFNRWVITKYEHVKKILRDKNVCVRDWEKYATADTHAHRVGSQVGKMGMLDADGDEHKRLRDLVAKPFNVKAVRKLKPKVEAIVDETIKGLQDKPTFEFISEYATTVPIQVMSHILGVDPQDQEDFKLWSDQLLLGINPTISDEQKLVAFSGDQALRKYFADIIVKRKNNKKPDTDIVSQLVMSQKSDAELTDAEIVTSCIILLVAGYATTADFLGNALIALFEHPEELQKLKNDLTLIPKATEELLRYDGSVNEIPRITAIDMELGGQHIKSGETLSLMLAGANHDGKVFECPHQLKIDRDNIQHRAFGGGRHYCLGAPLTRLIVHTALEKLFLAFPNLRLADDEAVIRKNIPQLSGYQSILVSTN